MRPCAGLLLIGVAVALGTLMGAVVLPDRGVAGLDSPRPTGTIATASLPSRSVSRVPSVSSSPTPSEGGPLSSTNLITSADFRNVGLTVTAQSSYGRLDGVVCQKRETLDEIALSGPPLQQLWEEGDIVATEQAIAARYYGEAADVVKRVLRKLEVCQSQLPGHWVYGPTHTERLGSAISANWLGSVTAP